MELHDKDPTRLFECLKDIPVRPGREGSNSDAQVHYSVELWRKAKALNKGRGVLGCALAHLIAMRTLVEGGYDLLIEDNVRAPTESTLGDDERRCECAKRIWETIDASHAAAAADDGGSGLGPCHLRYYGWLGSRANLEWVIKTHAERTSFQLTRSRDDIRRGVAAVFPFPAAEDIDINAFGGLCLEENAKQEDTAGSNIVGGPKKEPARGPGGTPIWGAYAYWISRDGLEAVLSALRNDVGALLWKGKRMRCYTVKPVDKIMPRRIERRFGRRSIHVTSSPAFFRAPMLVSTIHKKWDAEFCRSTEYQMAELQQGLKWKDLWLTEEERAVVKHRERNGVWVYFTELPRKGGGDIT